MPGSAPKTRKMRERPKPSKQPGSGPKYGDVNFKMRDPDRKLPPSELHLLCAEWQRTRSVSMAARAIGIEPARAWEIIMAYAKQHPDVLENPDWLLLVELEMYDLAAMAMQQAKDNMDGIYGRQALMTAWIARQKAEAYHKARKERLGAAATEDPEKLEKELEGLDDELKRFSTDTAAEGQADSQAEAPGEPTDGALDENVGSGGDERA